MVSPFEPITLVILQSSFWPFFLCKVLLYKIVVIMWTQFCTLPYHFQLISMYFILLHKDIGDTVTLYKKIQMIFFPCVIRFQSGAKPLCKSLYYQSMVFDTEEFLKFTFHVNQNLKTLARLWNIKEFSKGYFLGAIISSVIQC